MKPIMHEFLCVLIGTLAIWGRSLYAINFFGRTQFGTLAARSIQAS
jgi:hypothetical protein